MDPFAILGGISALVGIVGTFAGMGASVQNYELAKYNSAINMLNTEAGYTQAMKQAVEGEKAARSNVSTLDFAMGQYTTQQEQYKTNLLTQQSQIIGTQKTIQAATGIGGAGTSRKLQQDIVNKVKEYTDIIDDRLIVTGEFDEFGTRIVNSEMDQLLLDQDTQRRQADLFAEYAIDNQEALEELEEIAEEFDIAVEETPSELETFAESFGEPADPVGDFFDDVGEVIGNIGEFIGDVGEAVWDFLKFW